MERLSGLIKKRRHLITPVLIVLLVLIVIGGFVIKAFSRASAVLPSDIDNDGVVDVFDLSKLLADWGKSGPSDINGDGTVDIFDLSILLAHWGAMAPTPPPTASNTPIASVQPTTNPPLEPTPAASDDHRQWIHGVNLVKHHGKDMLIWSSNNYPPTVPSGDWTHDIYYSYLDLANPNGTFSQKTLVAAPQGQEPASADVNSLGSLMVTAEDAQFSANLDQTYGIWDSSLNPIVPYGAKLMPPQGGHSGHVAASGDKFLVSFSEGWVNGGGVDNLGTGDDVFAKVVGPTGTAGSMIDTAVGTATRDWWPIAAGSDSNWLQVWQRYGAAGNGGGTLLGAIIDHSGTIVKQMTIYTNNLYYYHDVQYIPSLGMYLVVGSQFTSSNPGVAVLIDKQGNVVATKTGLPATVREAQTVISGDGKTAVYPALGIGAAVLDLTSNSINLRKTVAIDWSWDYMGTAGAFSGPGRVLFATGTQNGMRFITADF